MFIIVWCNDVTFGRNSWFCFTLVATSIDFFFEQAHFVCIPL